MTLQLFEDLFEDLNDGLTVVEGEFVPHVLDRDVLVRDVTSVLSEGTGGELIDFGRAGLTDKGRS